MIASVCQLFHPLPLPDDEDELILKLKNLYLGSKGEDDLAASKEKEMKTRVCGTVLTSYDMSLRDTMQLAASKLQVAGVLMKQLDGGLLKDDKLTASSQENGPK